MEMIITLIEQATNSTSTTVSVNNEIIIVNDVEYDLSAIPNGSQVEAEFPAIGTIKNIDNEIYISILYQYVESEAELIQSKNADDYVFDISEGEVLSPIKLKTGSEINV
jgi:hypothetical protein